MSPKSDDDKMIEQRFAFAVIKRVDPKTKRMQVQVKTKGQGIPLPEAVIILEGWIEKVKKELQKPYTSNLKFSK
jgi:hypothetical protein